jgi:hypothetical protein
MPEIIIIREIEQKKENSEEKFPEKFQVQVQFGASAAPHKITIQNPFSKEQEARLEWYFEKWLDFPFTDKIKAKEAEADILAYGENLFNQIFAADRDIIREYDRFREHNSEFHIEIAGSPEFHALHWEAIKDPDQSRPLSVDKPIVRKNSQPIIYEAKVKSAPLLRVLLISARPSGARDVSYRTISRPLVESLETGKIAAQIDIVRPGTYETLVKHLEDVYLTYGDGYYHLLHLDLHGALLSYEQYKTFTQTYNSSQLLYRNSGYAQKKIEEYEGLKAFLFFNGTEGEFANPVSAEDLANLFKMRQIPIVILNACQSGKQVGAAETSLGSYMLKAGVQLVVAMGYSVTVSAARILMSTLYQELLDGRNPDMAILRARLELYNDKARQAAFGQEIKLEDWLLPVIYQNRAPDFDSSGFQNYVAPDLAPYKAPRTTYKFVGRDIEILEIENHLLIIVVILWFYLAYFLLYL